MIRDLASIIGNLVATFPAIPFGKLHYRELEFIKIQALKNSHGNFDAVCSLSVDAANELQWWTDHILQSFSKINRPEIDCTIYTDASNEGWGIHNNISSSGGRWNNAELLLHINAKELLAAKFGIISYCKAKKFKHVRLMSDNTTAIAYLNNMGGIKSKVCNKIAKDIWSWCEKQDLWLSAAFIPGKENTAADKASREFMNDATEWHLNTDVFNEVCREFGCPDIDLFASRNNKQLPNYVSWHPEPEASAVDAFSITWADKFSYIFPPFSIIGQVLHKILDESASAILIVPQWSTQCWYPMAMHKAKQHLALGNAPTLLDLTHKPEEVHPLFPKLHLLALLM